MVSKLYFVHHICNMSNNAYRIGETYYLRAKKIMHRFLLILLGTYDAIVRMERNTSTACPNSAYVQK